jgi:hypothetical protein
MERENQLMMDIIRLRALTRASRQAVQQVQEEAAALGDNIAAG